MKKDITYTPEKIQPDTILEVAQLLPWFIAMLCAEGSGMQGEPDPDWLIVALLRKLPIGSPARIKIGETVLAILKQVRKYHKLSEPRLFDNIMRVCQQVQVPETSDWFLTELERVCVSPTAAKKFWRDGDNRLGEIMHAALQQCRKIISPETRNLWLRLLRTDGFSTFGLLGLDLSFEDEIKYLKIWWEHAQTEEPLRELRGILRSVVEKHGVETVESMLFSTRRRWPKDLVLQLKVVLEELRLKRVPQRRSHYWIRVGVGNLNGVRWIEVTRNSFLKAKKRACFHPKVQMRVEESSFSSIARAPSIQGQITYNGEVPESKSIW